MIGAYRFDLNSARNEELGKKALAEITSQGISNVKYQQLDITDNASIARFAKYIKDTHGGLDVLINNAAIAIFVRAVPELTI